MFRMRLMWREQEEGDDTSNGWEAVQLVAALNKDNRIEDNRILASFGRRAFRIGKLHAN